MSGLLTSLALLFSTADAVELDPYADLAGGWFWTSPNEHIDSTWTVVPRIGAWLGPHVGLEAELGYGQGVTRSVGYVYTLVTPRVDVRYRFRPEQRVQPFVEAGPGVIRKKVARDPDAVGASANAEGWGNYENPDTDFLLNAGPGLQVALTDRISLRTDLRWQLNLGTEPHGTKRDVFSDVEWTVGLSSRLGRVDNGLDALAEAEELVEQATPAVAEAVMEPEPEPEPIVEPVEEEPAFVVEVGEPEPEPATEDEDRVVALEPPAFEPVFFAFDDSGLAAEALATLERAAGTLAEHTELDRVYVTGHTDPRGDDAYNLALSQSRAEAVVDALVALGVDRERLVTRALGEAEAAGTTAEAHAADRKVVLAAVEDPAMAGVLE